MVLPCIGSHTHTTRAALALHRAQQRRQQALDLVGAHAGDQRQPAGLVVRVERVDQAQQIVRPAVVGPTFRPIGFFTPRMNSTCAPSGWRVRSPIHRKCAEQAYQSPEVESTRVSACS